MRLEVRGEQADIFRFVNDSLDAEFDVVAVGIRNTSIVRSAPDPVFCVECVTLLRESQFNHDEVPRVSAEFWRPGRSDRESVVIPTPEHESSHTGDHEAVCRRHA
ncbi:hypothetical protein D9M68_851480 [compost metagenome]